MNELTEKTPAKTSEQIQRRYPVGAEVTAQGVHFRVWAPDHKVVEVVLDGNSNGSPLSSEGNGYFSDLIAA